VSAAEPGSQQSAGSGAAFDLIEFNGDDLRREPLDTRKATLASVLRRAAPGLRSASACHFSCIGEAAMRITLKRSFAVLLRVYQNRLIISGTLGGPMEKTGFDLPRKRRNRLAWHFGNGQLIKFLN
jgi:hypothetical protein